MIEESASLPIATTLADPANDAMGHVLPFNELKEAADWSGPTSNHRS